jgi:hypothetical protein
MDLGTTWRREITPFLTSLGIVVIDPTNKPISGNQEDIEYTQVRKELKTKGDYKSLSLLMKNIRSFDLRCTDICDWAIAYLDYSIPMTGTFEEIFTLNRSKKPILVFCKQGISNIGDWLFGALPYEMFFDNWDKLRSYIINIHTGKDTNYLNRLLFDYDRLQSGK